MIVTGAKKGRAVGRFWEKLAYSRVISWGREFLRLKAYLAKNTLEALGFSRSREKIDDVGPGGARRPRARAGP